MVLLLAISHLLLLGHTDGAAPAAGGLGVLTADADTPVVADTAVGADLLEALKVLTELVVQTVGKDLGVLAVLEVLLPVEEPVGDLVLAGVLDDGHDALELGVGELTGPLVGVNIGLPAGNGGEAAPHTLDGGQGENDLLATVDVGVHQTDDVLEGALLGGDK
eukprot:CAMPEP_0197008412 /NCGR_PEP_ID=MMETSP1380-20130617/45106_1 /TAXON_ID=5936 /ORGANISM="Euplotes crassus, Strain CT5" /LENGTH=162 /DNA_ID=CAMNT_0042428987 /DNA_START=30 /DNA_END=515 /DNA_ORIENTATION=+